MRVAWAATHVLRVGTLLIAGMKILVTGANGFIGRAVLARLLVQPGAQVVGCVRTAQGRAGQPDPAGASMVTVASGLSDDTDWLAALDGVQSVVHTAARVHVAHAGEHDPLQEFRRINVQGTLCLARQAAEAGVRRFVFVSSIKVNGEATAPGQAFSADDSPAPLDAYGVSKWEAEQGLWAIARSTGMEMVIVRPPLVYGPGVKANFAALLRVACRGWPLPLGAVDNRRSYLALDNLVDFLALCLVDARAANQTFVVSDGRDLSTRDLVLAIAHAAGVRPHLLYVPVWMLRWSAAALGRRAMAQRLFGNLQLDNAKAQSVLGWRPPVSADDALRRVVEAMVAR